MNILIEQSVVRFFNDTDGIFVKTGGENDEKLS